MNRRTAEEDLYRKMVIGFIAGTTLLAILYLFQQHYGYLIDDVFRLIRNHNGDEIAEYLNRQSAGIGHLVLYVISILQVVSVVIPGMVIQVSSSLIYGWYRSFLICWLGFTSGNALVFFVARTFRNKLKFMTEKEAKSTWLTEKFSHGNPVLVVMVACMIPGVPNGIIPYIAANSRISLKKYTMAVFLSSWLQILLNCVIGHFLIRGEWVYMLLAILLQLGLIAGILIYRNVFLRCRNKD